MAKIGKDKSEKGIKPGLFTHEVMKTSSVLSRNNDVKVVFAGEEAVTDGNIITLPSIDLTKEVSKEQAAVMRGYVDHESGHVRHSSFEARTPEMTEFMRDTRQDKLLKSIVSAVEDIRLERKVMDEYGGSKHNFEAVADVVNRKVKEGIDDGSSPLCGEMENPAVSGPVAITWEGRKGYVESSKQMVKELPLAYRRMLSDWVAQIDGLTSTEDSIRLGRQVVKEIHEARDNPPGGGSGPGEGDGDGEESEGEGQGGGGQGGGEAGEDDGEGENEGEGGGEGEGEGEGGGEGGEAEEGEDEGQGQGSGEGQRKTGEDKEKDGGGGGKKGEEDGGSEQKGGGHGATDPMRIDLTKKPFEEFRPEDAVGAVLEEDGYNKGLKGSGGYRPYTTAHDKIFHWKDEVGKWGPEKAHNLGRILAQTTVSRGGEEASWKGVYDDILLGMSGATNVMRRKLEKALLAKEQRSWDYAKLDGRLDSKRLVAAVSGRENVFKVRDDSKDLDTAVSFVVDLSGSMGGHKAKIAQQCLMAMAEAIERTSISYEVLGFNGATDWRDDIPMKSKDGRRFHNYHDAYCDRKKAVHYGRYSPIDIYVFKTFTERLNEIKHVMAKVNHMVNGDNCDGESIAICYDRLRKRPEKRKIMLVLSDGHPATTTDSRHAVSKHLKSVVRGMEADGVDCVGIGICDRSVKEFYRKNIVVDSVEELANVGMDQLARLLLGDGFVVDNRKLS